MKNSKLLIGTSLITMLTTGAVGTVATTQKASAYDVTASQATAQYPGTYGATQVTQSTQSAQSGVTGTTGTQTNTQTTTTTQASSSSKGAAIYQAALSQVGTTQDCTMLVTNALKSVGINYHDWPAGYMSLGTTVSASEAQPGDLIYYADGGTGVAHIAVYAGNGQAVHGDWLGNQTVVNSVDVGSGAVYIRVN